MCQWNSHRPTYSPAAQEATPVPFFSRKLQLQPLNQQPTTGYKCSFRVLGRLRVMGYTDLNCPEIPSHRRLADESPGQPTTMDNLLHAHHHLRNASNQWIPTICQILIQTRITSQLCHNPAFSDGTYLNHQDYTTTFLSLYKITKSSLYSKIPSVPNTARSLP